MEFSIEDCIPRRIFVGGIDHQTTESQLQQMFEVCGPVVVVNIVKQGDRKTYAFVTFKNHETVQAVLSNRFKFYIRGRLLRLSPAFFRSKPRPTFH